MFIRVKSKATGHEFDIHEHQFDDAKHLRLVRYPPSSRVRRTKFRVGILPAFNVSAYAGKVGKDVSEHS